MARQLTTRQHSDRLRAIMAEQGFNQPIKYTPVTKEQAQQCTYFHANGQFDSKGDCRIWRRSGRTQTWKRDTTRFRTPTKYGLYTYGEVTNQNAHRYHTEETCPFATSEEREQAHKARMQSHHADNARVRLNALYRDGTIIWDGDKRLGGLGQGGWYYTTKDQNNRTTIDISRPYEGWPIPD